MPEITEDLITMVAPNAAAITNAKKISKKGEFISLNQSEDDSLIFGECQGSGKNPYRTSVDFSNPANPVFRCSCPSRQFPCKHGLAILYEYLAGKQFTAAPIPEDILEKREKQAKSAEKKKSAAPKQVNKAALAKKMKKQMEGLALADKFVSDLLKTGLAASTSGATKPFAELAKQLGDYYLPGPQAMVKEILLEMERMKKTPGKENECYRHMVERLVELHATVKKGRAFLENKLEKEQILMEDSLLYDRLGTVWQLSQLKELNLFKENAELVQLSFHILYDEGKAEYADTGWWVDLKNGEVSKTLNLRPIKAIKHLKQDDTVFECVQTPCLYYYPGEQNKRIRWEEALLRPVTSEDRKVIRSFAKKDIAAFVKEGKNTIKNPLSENAIVALLAFHQIGKIGEKFVLEDAKGVKIELKNREGKISSVNQLLYLPDENLLKDQVLCGELFYDSMLRQFAIAPHSIITEEQIIRLLY